MCLFLTVLVVVAYVHDAKSESYCRLDNDERVQYCFDPSFINGLRRCNTYEPEGVILRPGCSASSRFSIQLLAPRRCVDGQWDNITSCKPAKRKDCKLDEHESVNYNCLGPDDVSRSCSAYEPAGTIVRPECKPAYFSIDPLPLMKCSDGKWNYIATCLEVCGRESSEESLQGGTTWWKPATNGEVPWHAAIYIKSNNLHEQIAGGSLVSPTVIISAAHPFWWDLRHQQSDDKYAVAIGKLYRLWDDQRDINAQKSEVKSIYLPDQFQGIGNNYQDDIAVMVVATAFRYNYYVRPVCLNFGDKSDKWQLNGSKIGKVAGWQDSNTRQSTTLKITELSYIDTDCYEYSPNSFKKYITLDKICVAYIDGESALCEGDTGGGVAFSISDVSKQYYLKGVVSTMPIYRNQLCSRKFITLTHVIKHEKFIKKYL